MQVLEPLAYIGPNRRSDKTVIEWPLQLTTGEREKVDVAIAGGWRNVRARLDALGWKVPAPGGGEAAAGADPASLLTGQWVCAIALALQRMAGHRVGFSTVLPGSGAGQCRLVFEYEHLDTGADAGELALRLLSECIPGLQWQADGELSGLNLEAAYRAFLIQAEFNILPLDAQVIIDAAARLDVPCVKLEREPYGGLPGDFRIRRNGLLKLGHSCYQHIVDGTLCIDRNAALVPLLFDREALYQCMRELQLPAPRQDPEFRRLITSKRAIRAADKIGYPVLLKALKRSRSNKAPTERVFMPLSTAAEVRQAFEQFRASSPQVIVEQYVAGETIHLLLADHEPLCVVAADGRPMLPSALHGSILEMAQRVSQSLGAGLLGLTLVTPDPDQPLADAGGAVVDLDPAPQLDRLLAADAALMALAAEGFVRWLYPPGAPCRIPLVAVTGTNGKTTTSRMIARIARTAGFLPGMASTSGVYFNEVLQQKGDLAGSGGHHILFESRDINFGVLETARGAVAHSGFMFDWCDVAVCLNVTEDHIGEYDIHTLGQMVALKRSILERARRAVVLNADYTTCRDMLPFAEGIVVYMVTLNSQVQEIRDWAGEGVFACVLEAEAGETWIILHEPGGRRLPLLPVSAIPATVRGAARFNISNAQHAFCACHAIGLGLDAIQQGLGSFEASFENTPGRLNIHRELPFTVILDYVHNPDGMEKLCEFVNQLDVTGRKILVYSAVGNRTNQEVAAYARSPVGHFDHYLCSSYADRRGREPDEIPTLMKAAMLDAGVAEERITVVADTDNGPQQAMKMARRGDVVVLAVATGKDDELWQEIRSFQPEFSD